MSATGLEVFDKTLQTTHFWLDDIMQELGPDRQVAWHALGVRQALPESVRALWPQSGEQRRGRRFESAA